MHITPKTYDSALVELTEMRRRLAEAGGSVAELESRLAAHQRELDELHHKLQLAWHKQDASDREVARLQDADQKRAKAVMRLEEAYARIEQLEAEAEGRPTRV